MFKKLFGDPNARKLKKFQPIVAEINLLAEDFAKLTDEDLARILVEPRNALVKQYQQLFKMSGQELSFDEDALIEIARLANARNTGARGLRSIVEGTLKKAQFEAPSDERISKIRVTKQAVADKGKSVKYTRKRKKKADPAQNVA